MQDANNLQRLFKIINNVTRRNFYGLSDSFYALLIDCN
ncbi:unknown protein [Cronobacter turicensis z3032]|uniref:Uncharacterized protein n=1 Tax=Cronobacter turicensis (strain DSM 18703 / CCUG 55852 / LMG 23827 / z3032) TaxID=693216 RepID=C9XZ37_CROTZ|nr:unknown protein [Cronobacter turicensis z3032]